MWFDGYFQFSQVSLLSGTVPGSVLEIMNFRKFLINRGLDPGLKENLFLMTVDCHIVIARLKWFKWFIYHYKDMHLWGKCILFHKSLNTCNIFPIYYSGTIICRTAVAATDDQNLKIFKYIKQMAGIWTFSRLRDGSIIKAMFK